MIKSTKFLSTAIGSFFVTAIDCYAMYLGHFEFTTLCVGIIGGGMLGYTGFKTLQNHLLVNGNGNGGPK